MFPALTLSIIAPTRRDHMQVGMVLTITPVSVDHRDIATLERLASDLAIEVVEALPPTPHQLIQQDFSVLVEWRAKHGRDGQDDMSIDHPLVQDLAHLAHPVIHVDFGARQAQRRFTTHRHPMFALTTIQTAILDIAHFIGITAVEPLVDETLIVGRVVARTKLFKPLPVIDKDPFEDVRVPSRFDNHRMASSQGVGC